VIIEAPVEIIAPVPFIAEVPVMAVLGKLKLHLK